MKKVLIVIPTLGTGGGEKLVMDLAYGLDKTKFQVKVLVLYKKTGSIFDRFAEEKQLDMVYLDKRIGVDWKMFPQVRRIVKEFAPDVIHTHLDTMLYLLPLYRRKQRKLHTVHSMAEKEASGLQRAVRLAAFKLFGVVPVAISNTVKESIAQVYPVSQEKIPTVNNGVLCSRYDRPKTEAPGVRLISVGTLYAIKNHRFLIDCFAEIRRIIDNVELTLVGDGVLRQDIARQIKELHLEDSVTLAGAVTDVETYLANADLYVAASLYEGLPLSILEAMASGLPIVSTRVGGVPDVVQDGVNGRLVPLDDKSAYIAAVMELVQNTGLRTQYAAASKRLAKKYDLSQMVAGYEALYNQ